MSDISNQPDMPDRHSTPEDEARGAEARKNRRSRGLSMGDIADALGCSVSHVSDAEHGYAPFTPDERALLLALFLSRPCKR